MKKKIEGFVESLSELKKRIRDLTVNIVATIISTLIVVEIRIRGLSSAKVAVYAYYFFLAVTPFVGAILTSSYIYNELGGYFKVHSEMSKPSANPFYKALKPGLENNILQLIAILLLNLVCTSIILSWF